MVKAKTPAEPPVDLDTMPELPKPVSLNLKTLRGDLRDLVLGAFKARPKPWKEMSELDQKQMAHDIDVFARETIDAIARVIAGEGATTVPATLEAINIKDGMKLTLKAVANHANLDALADQVGSEVIVVKPVNKVAQGEKAKPKIDKDQTSLIPDDDDDLLSSAADGAAESVGSKAAKDFAEDNPGSAGGAPDADAPLADPAAEAEAALDADDGTTQSSE